MKDCEYLDGENIKPHTTREARKLIGKKVSYLCQHHIDHNRGSSCLPKVGIITDVLNRELVISGDYILISRIAEMVEHDFPKGTKED